MIMLFISFFKWWYSDGLRHRAQMMSTRLDGVIDYFSIDLLIKTLFQPFRQDSTGKVDGSLDMKLRALADNMISRVLGAIIRTVILVFGLIAIAIYSIVTIASLIVWIIVPAAPIIGVALAAAGVSL